MADLSRRSFMKKIGGISALSAMTPLVPWLSGCQFQEAPITLNVVLHGLFVLDFQDSCIELLTPVIHDHVYRAGNWDRPEVFDLEKKKTYRLRGTDPIAAPPLVDPCNVVLSHSCIDFDVDSEKSFLIVQLPFPAAIHSLRCINDQPLTSGCDTSPDPTRVDVYQLSLCQALVYPVSSYHDLELVNSPWQPSVDEETDSANLHFWAEPEKHLSPKHAQNAYAKLGDLLPPLHMSLHTDKVPPLDADTGVRGLPREEEEGWAEWQNGGEGSAPTNCCGVMVNAQVKSTPQNAQRRPRS